MAEVQPKVRVAGLGDHVLGGVVRMFLDAEGETQGVAAGDRTVFAKPVRVFDLTEMASRSTLDRVHEEVGRLLRVVPGHYHASRTGRA